MGLSSQRFQSLDGSMAEGHGRREAAHDMAVERRERETHIERDRQIDTETETAREDEGEKPSRPGPPLPIRLRHPTSHPLATHPWADPGSHALAAATS